jgi:hypothetical protein
MTVSPIGVPLRWIDDAPPARLPHGAVFGAPLPRGAAASSDDVALVDDAGAPLPAQTWPLATWPDGTVKWVGLALPATDRPPAAARVVAGRAALPETAPRLRVTEDAASITVDTGAAVTRIRRDGDALIESISVEGTVVAGPVRLVSSRQDSPEPNTAARVPATGRLDAATVEQDGPLRAVIRLEGRHAGEDGRTWLPFTLRLAFSAGARTFRAVHTFVWDGDPDRDFLSSLGLAVAVPMRGPAYDRHVRFVGADDGVLREAVQGVTGLRRDPGAPVREAQMDGRTAPEPERWNAGVHDRMRWVPRWPDYTLRQLGPNGFTIAKRTAADRPWIDIAHGTRAAGFAYTGTPSGGIGIGARDFWQSHPSGIDLRGADTDTATLTLWLWSPDAPPMDLRFYHDGLGQDDYRKQIEALEITYEDYEAGLGSAHGISRTHEIDLVPYTATPGLDLLVDDARHLTAGPRLAPTPQALRDARAFGDWDLPDRSTPARAALEDRLDAILDFYLGQVEQRQWYGFWNYGDLMHAYDHDRHTWRYDIGGYAWDNSELATDLWLWTSFARTGRADVFRLAEAMARHTGDVDAYHAGPLKGLGTRHNVQHWGCGCKQLRIGSPVFRRPHYLLTADEHSRDRITGLRDSDRTFLALDPSRKARPDQFPPPPPSKDRIEVGLGTDWGTLAATWLADWEITGNEHSRDRLLATMADLAAFPHGFLHGHARYDLDRGRLTDPAEPHISHLAAIFGLVELCSELIDLVDVPGFRDAWLRYCRLYFATPEEQAAATGTALPGNLFPQWHSRLLAYAAARTGDDAAADRAWAAYFEGGEVTPADLGAPRRITPPHVLAPVDELPISTNDAAQSSLAAIQNLALIGHRLR